MRNKLAVVGICAAGLGLSGATAAEDVFQYIPATTASADVAKMKDGLAFKIYADHDAYNEQMSARDKTGQVEIHSHWTDHFAVISGEATLTVGGTAVGMKDTGPGEQKGDHITGGKTMPLHPGDLVNIPAGMPHWIQLAPGKKILYFVVKTRA